MDHERIKAEQRAMYEAGDYSALSATLRPAARELIVAAGVVAGQRVLDVGSGDGNLAIEAASRGAFAVGCDLSVVQAARARGRDGRVSWVAADAERLPIPDQAFDAVLSCFGAVFAPDPLCVTAELFRVVRPGGVVALSAWADDGYMGELTAALRSSMANSDTFPDQDLGWGRAEAARERLATHAASVEVSRRAVLIDPAVRGADGDRDFALRYLSHRTIAADFARARAEISRRHLDDEGVLRSDYLLILGRAPT